MLVLSANAAAAERAVVLDIDGVIGPAIADYVVRELRTVNNVVGRLAKLARFNSTLLSIDTEEETTCLHTKKRYWKPSARSWTGARRRTGVVSLP